MKRITLLISLVLLITTMSWAQQGRGQVHNPRNYQGPRYETETLSVSGPLTIVHGSPAIKNNETTYIIKGISRLAGFVDGLKEGAQVTVAGSSVKIERDDNIRVLVPRELTLNGKVYDMSPLASAPPNFKNNGWDRGPGRPHQKHQAPLPPKAHRHKHQL